MLLSFIVQALVTAVSLFLAVSYWQNRTLRKRQRELASKVVLITGGGCGIGRQLAVLCAKTGANVVLWDIHEDGMAETEKMARSEAPTAKIQSYRVDVSSRSAVYSTAKVVTKEVGPVDILVNNAGVAFGKSILEIADDEIETTMNTNCLAHFWTIRAFLGDMYKRNSGHIVTVSSVAAFQGMSHLSAYTASKFGVFGLSDCIRHEVSLSGCDKVFTTALFPYLIDTGMFDGLRVPWGAPFIGIRTLSTQEVADRLFRAILLREQVVVMPAHLRLLHAMRLLPTALMDWLAWVIGASTAMATFKGRGRDFVFQRQNK